MSQGNPWCRGMHAVCVLALCIGALDAHAQFPASGLRQGTGVDPGGPPSAFRGSPAPAAGSPQGSSSGGLPAWTPRSAATAPATVAAPAINALQQADLPSDLAQRDDNGIIIVGGKPITVAELKRGVLGLDDNAIIIVGGRKTQALALKREIRGSALASTRAGVAGGASARVPAQGGAPAAGPAMAASPASSGPAGARPRASATHATRVNLLASGTVNTVAPKRAALQRQFQQLRAEQDRAFQDGLHAPARNPTVAARAAAAPTFAGSSSALRASVGLHANALGDPGIVSVNGRIRDVHASPGAELAIAGNALGDRAGTVQLTGGGLARNPVPLTVSHWSAEAIEAAIPGGTRGVPDEPNAVLEVRTAAGATYRFEGLSFVAARGEATVKDGQRIAQYMLVEPAPSWHASLSGNAVARGAAGESIDCPRPGTDVLRFRNLDGFEVIGAGMVHARTDTGDGDMAGNPGGRVYFAGYTFGDWRNEPLDRTVPAWGNATVRMVSALPVSWGVFRSHTSPGFSLNVAFFVDPVYTPIMTAMVNLGTIPGTAAPVPFTEPLDIPRIGTSDAHDVCLSAYQITSLTVYGPLGVAP